MDNDDSSDPLSSLKIDKIESENANSPKSLSEFDELKMELEQELAMEAQTKEKAKDTSNKVPNDASSSTTKTQKPINAKSLETKKSSKGSNEKNWLSAPHEESSLSKKEKKNNLVVTLKLFDRGLVVNGFAEDASLYTLSRAWMKNQKHSLASSQFNILAILAAASKRQNNGLEVLKHLQNGQAKFICSMPAVPTKNSAPETSRVPSIEQLRLKYEPDIAGLNDILTQEADKTEGESIILKQNLLTQHKLRWKKTKSNWIKHVRNSDKQYEVNFTILETLYKSHMKFGTAVLEPNEVKFH